MTLTTQCPSCQTRFKVATDQLAKAHGRVRCGHCNMIFNALEFLDAQPEVPRRDRQAAQDEQPVQQTPPEKTVRAEPLSATQPKAILVAATQPNTFPPLYPIQDNEPQYTAPPRPGPRPRLQRTPPSAPANTTPTTPPPAATAPAATAAPRRRLVVEDEVDDQSAHAESYDPGNYNADDFALDDYYRPEPKTPTRRNAGKLFAILSLCGTLFLIGQLVIINRVNLSANFPDLAPMIKSACNVVGCTVALPNNADMLRTEWSEPSHIPEHPNLMQIDAVLKNHAHYAQSYPMLELSLKNKQDQVIARRQLTPKEYLKPTDLELGQFNADSEVRISLRLEVDDLQAVGYNLRWYFPQADKT